MHLFNLDFISASWSPPHHRGGGGGPPPPGGGGGKGGSRGGVGGGGGGGDVKLNVIVNGGGGGAGGGGDGSVGVNSLVKKSAVISSHKSSRTAQNTCRVFTPPPHVALHSLHGPTSQWWYVHLCCAHCSTELGFVIDALYAVHVVSGTTRPAAIRSTVRASRRADVVSNVTLSFASSSRSPSVTKSSDGPTARHCTNRRRSPEYPHVVLHSPQPPVDQLYVGQSCQLQGSESSGVGLPHPFTASEQLTVRCRVPPSQAREHVDHSPTVQAVCEPTGATATRSNAHSHTV